MRYGVSTGTCFRSMTWHNYIPPTACVLSDGASLPLAALATFLICARVRAGPKTSMRGQHVRTLLVNDKGTELTLLGRPKQLLALFSLRFGPLGFYAL